MIYRELGHTGLNVSVIAFGGMRFFKHEHADQVVTRCLDRGINFFETGAYGGGQSEVALGNALRRHADRSKVILANKTGLGGIPDATQVRRNLEDSLEREQVDYFDLYSFWGMNTPEQYKHVMEGGPLEAVLKAKDDGLVRAIGFTTHARPEWIDEFSRAFDWDAITLKEHMLFSRHQDLITDLGRRGIGVIVMSPLAGGVVANPSPDIARHLAEYDTTAARLGLRYLVSNPTCTTIISGFEHPDEVDENVEAGQTEAPLSPTEQDLVSWIRQKTTELTQNFCTSCGYCMPCPEGVNIPGIFRLWNIHRGYGNSAYSKLEYGKMVKQVPWADMPGQPATACIECRVCENRCPENLPIVDDLKRAHDDLTEDD